MKSVFHISRAAFCVGLVLSATGSGFGAVVIDESKLPPPAPGQIDFARDIKPIFEQSCFKCHNTEKPKSHFRLDSRAAALKGGDDGVDILPGQSAKSPLIHYVAGVVADMQMPPEDKAPPLSREQIGVLRAWIDQGAVWSPGVADQKHLLSVTLALRQLNVQGDAPKFRELTWMPEGWNGGAEQFELQEKLTNDVTLTMEGHALRDDYQTRVTVEKPDVGFVRFGWEQYRKYYDDSGGYYPGFDPAMFRLNRDLYLDVGRAWADFGLTLPDCPRLIFGYEYQYRNGEKSTLDWGSVNQGGEARNIYPNSKVVDERTHIIKFDLDHDIRGTQLQDRFRAEFGDLKTVRRNVESFTIGNTAPSRVDLVKESYQHIEAVNTIFIGRQFKDWLYASGGYLYSKLNADAAASAVTMLPPGGFGFADNWQTHAVVLEQESHALNLSGQLGPFDGLTISGGVLSDWTRQTGFGNGNLDTVSPFFTIRRPATFNIDLDKNVVEEKIALRYTKIPFTVLFAEARLQQESTGESQEQVGGGHDFRRVTDATTDLRDFRVGFNTSPWRWLSLNAHYRHYQKENDYDHLVDESVHGGGYPAFIRALDRKTDEVETKLVLHPVSWLRTTFSYKLVATDYETVTDPATESSPNDISPGGQIHGRDYDANIFSANFTLTPWRRLYLSTTFSYEHSRTVTAQNNDASVAPYRGDIYSVLASANYALNPKTDLRATYSFSSSDFGQNNFADGLPLGITYQQHSVRGGLTRRFNQNLIGTLQYGFYLYDEPSERRLNNFTAHAIFATLQMTLP